MASEEPKEFIKGNQPKAAWLNWIVDNLRLVLNLTVGPGLELRRYPNGWCLSLSQKEPETNIFWAEIDGYVAISGAHHRWRYTFIEQRRIVGGWEDKPSGRTQTAGDGVGALNSVENSNTSTGVQGNSVDLSAANFPEQYDLVPVKGKPVVRMTEDKLADGTKVYSFEYVNAVDGSC